MVVEEKRKTFQLSYMGAEMSFQRRKVKRESDNRHKLNPHKLIVIFSYLKLCISRERWLYNSHFIGENLNQNMKITDCKINSNLFCTMYKFLEAILISERFRLPSRFTVTFYPPQKPNTSITQ